MIQISNEKCIGCGSCKKVCPMAVISMNEKKAVTVHEDCIDCGHCQGICPVAAITLNHVEETLRDAKKEVSFTDLQNLIESNRSIRIFKDQEVDKSEIATILRTLDYSASAKNEQPVKWIVVSSKANVEKISDLCTKNLPPEHPLHGYIATFPNPITVSAPHLLIAVADESFHKGHDDCVIKLTLASLLMHSKGIGSCFLGFLDDFINNDPAFKETLGLGATDKVYGALGFGYNNNEVYKKIPTRKEADVLYWTT